MKAFSPENPNSGHGHVYPRPDGMKARCGGPGMCHICMIDAGRKMAEAPDAGDVYRAELPGRLNLLCVRLTDEDAKTVSEAAEEIERLRSGWRPIGDYVRATHGSHILGWNEQWGVAEFVLHDDGWTIAAFNGQVKRSSPQKFMRMPDAPAGIGEP